MPTKQDKIQEIIDKSGNDLQSKVADYLIGRKWDVSFSPYYNDPATGKQREIDIIATYIWPIKDVFGDRNFGELAIRLFIECKHIKDPAVFWFRQKNIESAIKLAKDNNILNGKPDYYLGQNQTAQHHYVDNALVAKIVAKSGNRDDIFDAMNQCLNGLIFFSNGRNFKTPYHIDFPIIITDSLKNLHKRNSDAGHAPITEPFQLEIDYSYKQSNSDGNPMDITKYFLIDIVSFEKFNSFLNDLENRDIKLFRENLSFDLVQRAKKMHQQSRDDQPSDW